MTKVTFEQRYLERMDNLAGQIERLAAAIEQQNAKGPAAMMQTVGTPTGRTANVIPLYYGQKPLAETHHEQNQRPKVRRPRQSSRGKG